MQLANSNIFGCSNVHIIQFAPSLRSSGAKTLATKNTKHCTINNGYPFPWNLAKMGVYASMFFT